jgi:Na+/melibiose symporter-like transporter
MGVTLAPMMFLDLRDDLGLIAVMLFLHAIAAATQDAGIDAMAIATVPVSERGRLNAWMQVGMLGGRSLLAGGALILASHLGDEWVVLVLILLVCSSSFLLLISKQSYSEVPPESTSLGVRVQSFLSNAISALGHRSTWLGLAFAGVGGAAFEAVGALAGPFLIDKGFSTESVGSFFALAPVTMMISGALVGGYLSDRIGKLRGVTVSLVCIAVDICALAGMDAILSDRAEAGLILLLGVLYFGIGLFTSCSYALFMDLTDPRLAATQFSAFMGATNGCESWSAYAAGKLVGVSGYPLTFVIMSCISLLAIPILRLLPVASVESSGRSRRSHS